MDSLEGGKGDGGGAFEVLTRDFVLLFASGLLFMGSLYIIIPVLPLYMLDVVKMSRTQVGIVIGLLTVSSMLARPFIGRWSDRWGRKPLMVFGSLNFVAASLLYLAARNLVSLLFVVLFQGVGMACFHTAALTFVGDIAPAARRGQSMAWYHTSFNFGIMLGPLIGAYLRVASGYPSVFVAASVAAALSFVFLLFVSESKAEEIEGVLDAPRAVSHLKLVIYACVAAFAGTVVLGAVETFVPVYAQVKHIPHYALFFTVMAGTLIAFRLLAGSVPDVFGRRMAITLSVATLGASVIILAFTGSLWMLCIVAFIYGAGFAYHTPAISALLADKVPASELGGAFGLFLAAFEGGIATGAIVMGPASTALGFKASFIIIGIFSLSCAVFLGASYKRFTR